MPSKPVRWSAYCLACGFIDAGVDKSVDENARRHAEERGHRVFVGYEVRPKRTERTVSKESKK